MRKLSRTCCTGCPFPKNSRRFFPWRPIHDLSLTSRWKFRPEEQLLAFREIPVSLGGTTNSKRTRFMCPLFPSICTKSRTELLRNSFRQAAIKSLPYGMRKDGDGFPAATSSIQNSGYGVVTDGSTAQCLLMFHCHSHGRYM